MVEKPGSDYDAIVLAVAHNEFKEMDIRAMGRKESVLYDLKGLLDKSIVDERL
jgi:UDP-N-acetyl-D-galactosamine dehydrogenase